jgi:hypothetical protein
LAAIRDVLSRLQDAGESRDGMLDELEFHVRALDEWITNGGFLPSAWAGR